MPKRTTPAKLRSLDRQLSALWHHIGTAAVQLPSTDSGLGAQVPKLLAAAQAAVWEAETKLREAGAKLAAALRGDA